MLELKSKNLFINSGGGAQYCILRILDFYDLIGKNCLYLHKGPNSSLSSMIKFNKINFQFSSLKDEVINNLFRLDIIIVESNEFIEESYNIIREITDLPVIFIVDFRNADLDLKNSKGRIKIKNFDTAYLTSKIDGVPTGKFAILVSSVINIDSDKLENYMVEDIKSNWKTNLKDLKTQYIRDKNIRDLLGED